MLVYTACHCFSAAPCSIALIYLLFCSRWIYFVCTLLTCHIVGFVNKMLSLFSFCKEPQSKRARSTGIKNLWSKPAHELHTHGSARKAFDNKESNDFQNRFANGNSVMITTLHAHTLSLSTHIYTVFWLY